MTGESRGLRDLCARRWIVREAETGHAPSLPPARHISVWPVNLHVPIGILQRLKSEFAVELVRIARNQAPAAQALQFGMLQDGFHEPPTQPATAMLLQDED